MSVTISSKGEVLYCSISGEIDHHTAAHLRKKIDDATETLMPSLLVLDFSGVTFMDSSGIGLVMGRYRNMLKLGGKVHIGNPTPTVYKLMTLSGIERIATIDPVENTESYR